MDDARFLDELRRYWDEVAEGGPATPGDLDPELAATIRRLHALPDAPPPDPAYTKRLRENLMHTATAPIPWTIDMPGNGHAAPPLRPGQTHGPPILLRRPSWAWAQAALVLLLLAGLIAAYFAITQRQEPVRINPALSTPVVDEVQPGTWPMYRGNPARSGVMPGPGLEGQPAVLWQFAAGASATFPPAIADGVIYMPTDGGAFFALDSATGAMRWQAEGGFAMAATQDGVLFSVSADEALVARDLATNQELWRAAPGSRFWAPLVDGDTVYYGAEENLLVARDVRSGEERWVAAQTTLASRSAALADGVLVVGSDDHHLYGVDQATGETKWQYALGDENATIQTPAIAGGIAYVGTFGGEQNTFVALDLQTGAERWRLDGADGENFQAAGIADGLVYVPSDAGTLRALDAASGEERWTYTASEAVYSGPVIADGIIYEGTNADGNAIVLALDAATGDELWQFPLEGQLSFSPVLVDGRLYIGTELGNVYAIGSASDVPPGATPAVMTPSGVMQPTLESGVAGTPVAATDATMSAEWVLSTTDGSLANGLGGVTIDPFSRLWLCNVVDGSIQIFDRDGNQLNNIVGGLGSEPGQWNWRISLPNGGWWDGCAIAFGPDGTAYVTDGGNNRIQVLDHSGALIDTWSTQNEDDNRLFGPVGITLLANGELLVIDFGPQDIARRFSVDGDFLGYFEPGEGIDPEVFDPITSFEDDEGNLWVVEMAEHRVVKLAPDGTLLMAIGGPLLGTQPGQFSEPVDMTFDERGNIFVADDDNRRIQAFAPDGTFLAQFTGEEAGIPRFGRDGGGVGIVKYGGNGYLYVGDYSRDDFLNGEQRLIKFRVQLPDGGAAAIPGATPAP